MCVAECPDIQLVFFFFPFLICSLDILFENVNLLANTSDLNTQILQKYSLLSRVPLSTVCVFFFLTSVKMRHMFSYSSFLSLSVKRLCMNLALLIASLHHLISFPCIPLALNE